MTLHAYFKELSRRRLLLLSFFVFGLMISAFLIALQARTQYKSYLFFTVAPQQTYIFKEVPQPDINSFYIVSAADLFAETIIGWFADPALSQNLQRTLGFPAPKISAQKRTRQNLIVIFTTSTPTARSATEQAILTELQRRLAEYNEKTGTQFQLTGPEITQETVEPQILRDSLLGITGSAVLALLIITLFFVRSDRSAPTV